jgi:hypothetical protein
MPGPVMLNPMGRHSLLGRARWWAGAKALRTMPDSGIVEGALAPVFAGTLIDPVSDRLAAGRFDRQRDSKIFVDLDGRFAPRQPEVQALKRRR